MPVILISHHPDSDGTFEISPADLHHLRRSLRVKAGDPFQILLPGGGKAEAILIREGNKFLGRLTDLPIESSPPLLPLWIAIGMIRWPRLEWFVEKATELGVQRISLIRLSYSRFTKKNDNFINKINRLIKISSEAQKQCARPMAPKIDVPQPLDEWLRSLADTHDQNMQKIVFDETIASSPLSENFFQKRNSYLMLVGTEGGFTPEEVQSAERSGFERVSLGKTKFRAETAALYGACALDFYLKGKAAL